MKLNVEELLKECGYKTVIEAANDLEVTRMVIYNWKKNNDIPKRETLIYLMQKSKQRKYKPILKAFKSLGWL